MEQREPREVGIICITTRKFTGFQNQVDKMVLYFLKSIY